MVLRKGAMHTLKHVITPRIQPRKLPIGRCLSSSAIWRTSINSDLEVKESKDQSNVEDPTLSQSLADKAKQAPKKLTTLELDEQLRKKMARLSGDGDEAGIEYEDGKPVAMKRSVKNNMFRYI